MNEGTFPTLKQLRYFAALAETGHYRMAAERIGISQPSLSLQISNLEKVLGLNLVERGRAGAALTPAGRDVLDRARRILADVSGLMETSENLTQGLAGTFKLGSTPTLGPYLLPNVVRTLHEQFSTLRLFIRDGAPRDLLSDLIAGHHDLILTQLPVQSADVVIARLFREPLLLAVARDHPLAEAKEVNDPDLVGENILSLSSRYTMHAQISELAQELGATLRQEYEGTSLDAIRQMVAMNMGISFLPALYAQSEISQTNGDVILLPFRQGRFFRSLGLVWRKSASRQSRFDEFAEIIRTVTTAHFGHLVQLER